MDRRSALRVLGALGALAGLPWTGACRRRPPFAVGLHPWIGYETLYQARQFGWLSSEVRLVEGGSAVEVLALLHQGRVEAACLTLDEVLRARGEGIPLVVALVFDASAGADAVLARPGIQEPRELAGGRLGVEQGALGALMLAKLLEASGLRAGDLQVVDVPVERHLQAWERGEVDALVTYEPTATLLLRRGARRIFDSRRIPETIFDVLAVRRDRVAGRFRTLRGLLSAHFRALGHFQTNRQDAIYRVASRQGIRPEEVERALAGVLLPSLQGNQDYLHDRASRLLGAAAEVSRILAASGLLAREDRLEGLVDARWLPAEGV